MTQSKPSSEWTTLAQPPVRLASGEIIGALYTVLEHYGSGALGHTYRAHDHRGVRVAIKVVAKELVPTPAERAGFLAGVQKIIGRTFTNIAAPTDAGIDRDVLYVVSPWVKGRSLRSVLWAYRDAGNNISYEEVLGVIDGVVHSVRQLHAVTAHGAIYPESIQIAHDGRVMLSDAGIIGSVQRQRLLSHFEQFPDVYPYLSPEIRVGKPTSASSDLYAIGVLASELLTGDPASVEAGIAEALMRNLPKEVYQAIQDLIAIKPAIRAAALPRLLLSLGKVVTERKLPKTAALPRASQRTVQMNSDETMIKRSPGKRW